MPKSESSFSATDAGHKFLELYAEPVITNTYLKVDRTHAHLSVRYVTDGRLAHKEFEKNGPHRNESDRTEEPPLAYQ